METRDVLTAAQAAFKAGNTERAVELYREALSLQPDTPEIHYSLANMLILQGQLEAAVESFQQALRLQPDNLKALNNLGNLLSELRRYGEAVDCFQRALTLQPDYLRARDNLVIALSQLVESAPNDLSARKKLGSTLRLAGRLDEAEAVFRGALVLDHQSQDAKRDLANVLYDRAALASTANEAAMLYREALYLQPDFTAASQRLASIVAEGAPDQNKPHSEILDRAMKALEAGDLMQAEQLYRQILSADPRHVDAWHLLGVILCQTGRHAQGIKSIQEAIRLRPDFAEAHNNLGNALEDLQKSDEAVASFRRALELKPDLVEVHNNLGSILQEQQKLEEAIACYRRALDLKPDYAEAHLRLSNVLFVSGDYELGWPEYEWRWRSKEFTPRTFQQPQWDGGDLCGKTILIHAEQGLGDSFQFVRYLPLVRARGGRVIFECWFAHHKIFEHLTGCDELVAAGKTLPPFDVRAPLMSLPLLLNLPQPADSPKPPYLSTDSSLSAHWKNRLDELTGFKVGINWQGSTKNLQDWKRSIRLAEFSPFAKIPGVNLISLQQGYGSEQLQDWADGSVVTNLGPDVDKNAGAFMDTAAIVQNLDLVITIDSALAHLAGAMGRPVWVALSAVPDWRWGLHGESTDWYPSMRLYRQTKTGQWSDVFERMAEDLRRLASEKSVR